MAIDKTLAILREAIEIEKYGYEFYNKLRMIVKDKRGQIVLSYLGKLEVDHMRWLEDEYARQLESLDMLNEGDQHIKLTAIDEIFAVDALPYMFDGTDHALALEYAVQLEERSVEFYTRAMEHSDDDEVKRLFRKLADFERDHIELLENTVAKLKENNMWPEPPEHVHG